MAFKANNNKIIDDNSDSINNDSISGLDSLKKLIKSKNQFLKNGNLVKLGNNIEKPSFLTLKARSIFNNL